MLLTTNSKRASTLFEHAFDRYFTYIKRDDTEISFLNFRIIQSENGIRLDQTNHILQKVIKPYFPTQEKVLFQFSPFPFLANTFEITLFSSLPLAHEEHMEYAKIYKGNYNHWTGCLILSRYNASPTPATFYVLNHLLCYIYQHPHLPLMYRSSTNKANL